MSQGSMELPIRLVPLNEWQSHLALAVMGFVVTCTIPLIVAIKGDGDGGWVAFALPAFVAASIITCLMGAWQRSRKNSPWFHIEITPNAVAVASGFRRRRCKWVDLQPFTVVERPEGESGFGYYVIAPIGDNRLAPYRGTIDIRAAEYISDEAGSGARQLADWLNALRLQALSSGTSLSRVTPPPDLHNQPLIF